MTRTIQLSTGVYDAESFPYGLRCISCGHDFVEGERYARRPLNEDWAEIVCLDCV